MNNGKGVSWSSNVCPLGNRWVMDFDVIQSITPAFKGVVGLEEFYNQVTNSAAEQMAIGAKEVPELNLAGEMINNLYREFSGLFRGTAYNDFWELGAVVASLSAR